MRTFISRNTNTMAPQVYSAIIEEGTKEPSRNGDVLAFSTPCTFLYTSPEEMVNICPIRDANPFFHLMEAVAMVAGLNSVQFLSHFTTGIAQYSDDGQTFNAFYGTRMGEQFNKVITLLHKDPGTRQAVIQLWDKADLLKNTKDKACNMSMVFRTQDDMLDMTVFCRSNDLIYGGVTGANIVHFPFIHAIVCHELGLMQGTFYHVVNNAHIYLHNPHFENILKMKANDVAAWDRILIDADRMAIVYVCNLIQKFPKFIKTIRGGGDFINYVIVPMYNTFAAHKSRKQGQFVVSDIGDPAWNYAATKWLERRV